MDAAIPEDLLARVSEALYHGKKIEAIKWYRDLTGTGLAEAKRVVEQCEVELRLKTPDKFVTRPRFNMLVQNLVCWSVAATCYAFICVRSAVDQFRGKEIASFRTWIYWFIMVAAILSAYGCLREMRKLESERKR